MPRLFTVVDTKVPKGNVMREVRKYAKRAEAMEDARRCNRDFGVQYGVESPMGHVVVPMPLEQIARVASYADLADFARTVARMFQNGEVTPDGEVFAMTDEDAQTTLGDLIATARGLTNIPNPPSVPAPSVPNGPAERGECKCCGAANWITCPCIIMCPKHPKKCLNHCQCAHDGLYPEGQNS